MFGMVEHVLEHARKPMQRHRLVAVGEIPVVAVGAGRHAGGHLRVEFGRVERPLLARVVAEELLVQLASHLADDHVLAGLDRIALLGHGSEKFLHLKRGQVQAVHLVDRVQIDRHRQELPVHAGQHAVLVPAPLGELREVIEDLARVRVENVRAVFVHEHARVVVMVVGVARDVVAAVHDEDLFVANARQPFGQHAARVTRPDDQIIKSHEDKRVEMSGRLCVTGGKGSRPAPGWSRGVLASPG